MKNRVCRNCAFCHWRDQYCSRRDMDMSMNFMRYNTNCRLHRFPEELEDEQYEEEEDEL